MDKIYSNCCGELIPDYPDSDVCPKCKEHCLGVPDDPYKIKHAEVCLSCQGITVHKSGDLRGCICKDCWEMWKERFKGWEENGLYATLEGIKPDLSSTQ